MHTHSTPDDIQLAHEIRSTMPGADWYTVCLAAKRMQIDLLDYAAEWDREAEEARQEQPPEPTTPPAARTPAQRAADKAAYHLGQGLKLVRTRGAWLVPSGTRGGVIHRVGDDGQCSCEAGRAGKACWHVAAAAMVEDGKAAA